MKRCRAIVSIRGKKYRCEREQYHPSFHTHTNPSSVWDYYEINKDGQVVVNGFYDLIEEKY